MAPVTQLGLVLLTTATVALADRHAHARGHKHINRRQNRAYLTAPYGYSNGTVTAGPTGSGSVPDTTSTRTETLTSTITSTLVAPGGAYPSGGSGDLPVSDQSEPTCGGTVYVTVTDSVTVTATAGGAATTPSSGSDEGDDNSGEDNGEDESSSSSSSAPSASSPVGYAAASTPVTYAAPAASSTSEAAPVPSSAEAPAPSSSEAPAPSAPSSYEASSPSETAQPTTRDLPSYASSSAASTPTGYSGGSSGGQLKTKRGCLYEYGKNDCGSVISSNKDAFSWITNWGDKSDGTDNGLTFIPQLWGKTGQDGSYDHTTNWKSNCDAAVSKGAPAILGFNEPEISTQANLKAGPAGDIWNEFIAPYKGKATLVSPSVTSQGTNGDYVGINWLKDFSAKATWDATGLHMYANCASDIDNEVKWLQGFVDAALTAFPGKNVWVTEYGCLPESGGSEASQAEFIQKATSYLETKSGVDAYAAFKADTLTGGIAQAYAAVPVKK